MQNVYVHSFINFLSVYHGTGASQVVQWERIHLPMQEMGNQFLGWEDPLEKEIATHFSILAQEISWTEEPGGLNPWGCKRVRYDSATEQQPWSRPQARHRRFNGKKRPIYSCQFQSSWSINKIILLKNVFSKTAMVALNYGLVVPGYLALSPELWQGEIWYVT